MVSPSDNNIDITFHILCSGILPLGGCRGKNRKGNRFNCVSFGQLFFIRSVMKLDTIQQMLCGLGILALADNFWSY